MEVRRGFERVHRHWIEEEFMGHVQQNRVCPQIIIYIYAHICVRICVYVYISYSY